MAHVLVDGAPRARTVLACSHWPGANPPGRLRRDTSTEMALAQVAEPVPVPAGTGLAAVDHLDEDGLAALLVLVHPEVGRSEALVLSALARVGDFDLVEAEDPGEAARAAWALRRELDPRRSGIPALANRPRPVLGAELLALVLARLAGLVANPVAAAALAEEEESAYRSARSVLVAGGAQVEEHPEAGLAVVTVGADVPPSAAGTLRQGPRLPLHPAALHGATSARRLLVVQGGGYLYYDRYETWVSYVSRPLPARRDLPPLAVRLAELEGDPGAWWATPASTPVAVLATATGRASKLPLAAVVGELVDHLVGAPPAWPPVRGVSGSAAPRAGTTGRARARWRGRRPRGPST